MCVRACVCAAGELDRYLIFGADVDIIRREQLLALADYRGDIQHYLIIGIWDFFFCQNAEKKD